MVAYAKFLALCFSALIGSLILSSIIYRIKGGSLGLKRFSNEIVLAITCAAMQAGLLWVILRLFPAMSWFPYLLCVAVAIMLYKGGHGDDMDLAGPFVVAGVQLLLFFPAERLLQPVYNAIERALG